MARRLVRRQHGFSLIEVLIALTLLEIVGASLVSLLSGASALTGLARQRTLAQQAAASQIESIRAMDYYSVGTVGGNPSGTLPATTSINQTGLVGTLAIKVSYVNDPGPLSYTSYANYKKVTVTVTRSSDSMQLAQDVTYVAPPVKADESNAVIQLQVLDYDTNQGVPNVPVALATGPSAPESDITDAGGNITFAGLTPNPTSGAQAYYDLNMTLPSGYVALYDSVPPAANAHTQLSPGETWPTVLNIYQPATIYVRLYNQDGSPFTGSTTVTVSYTRNINGQPQQFTQNFAYNGSPLTITQMTEGSNTVQLIPGPQYTVSASGNGWTATPVTAYVPDDYLHGVLTHTFSLTVVPQPATVNVTVSSQYWWWCQNAANAKVTLTGGPQSISLTGYTTGSGGPAVFNNVPVGSGYTITSGSGSLTNQTVVGGTNNFTVHISPC